MTAPIPIDWWLSGSLAVAGLVLLFVWRPRVGPKS